MAEGWFFRPSAILYVQNYALIVVRFTPADPKPPVKLLEQDQSHQLVGKDEAGKREKHPRAGENFPGMPQGAADGEGDVAPAGECQLVQAGGHSPGSGRFASRVKNDQERARAQAPEDLYPLCSLHFFPLSRAGSLSERFVGDFHHIHPGVGLQAL